MIVLIIMKLKDLVNASRNKTNNQISFSVKSKNLKKIGLTPEHLLNMKIPKSLPKVVVKEEKFRWNQKGSK